MFRVAIQPYFKSVAYHSQASSSLDAVKEERDKILSLGGVFIAYIEQQHGERWMTYSFV